MAYIALYRKWRPQGFSAVIGQQFITTALKNEIAAGRIGHAYLFTGTRGTGKTSCAKIFAKAVNCLNPQNGEPCGVCDVCKATDTGANYDISEIDAATNTGVDSIRDLRDETAFVPALGRYKVYIIDEVHMLSNSAFNALLKIMEEPPEHVIFILATTEVHKVPATIISRCQRFDFNRIEAPLIASLLLDIAGQEGITLTKSAAALIARIADGSMRDALSLLDTCRAVAAEVDDTAVRSIAGISDKAYLFTISDAVSGKDVAAAIAAAQDIKVRSIETKRLVEELVVHYRNLMLIKSGGANADMLGLSDDEFVAYEKAALKTDADAALGAIRALRAALEAAGRGANIKIELELALFSLVYGTGGAQAAVQGQQISNAQTAAGSGKAAEAKPNEAKLAEAKPDKKQTSENITGEADINEQKKPHNVEQTAPPQQKAQGNAPQGDTQGVDSEQTQQQPEAQQQGMALFTQWQQVVAELERSAPWLFGFAISTRAYVDGKRVYIEDASDLFFNQLRTNQSSQEAVKAAIVLVTGENYSIAPLKKAPDEKKNGEIERLKNLGIDVEIN